MRREIKEYMKEVRNAEAHIDDLVNTIMYMEQDINIPEFQINILETEKDGWCDVRDYWYDRIAQARGYKDDTDYSWHIYNIWKDLDAEGTHIRR